MNWLLTSNVLLVVRFSFFMSMSLTAAKRHLTHTHTQKGMISLWHMCCHSVTEEMIAVLPTEDRIGDIHLSQLQFPLLGAHTASGQLPFLASAVNSVERNMW